jgi:uncharacterized integral membrane protein (TIGR00698 family)
MLTLGIANEDLKEASVMSHVSTSTAKAPQNSSAMPAWIPGIALSILISLAALGWDGRSYWLNGVMLAIVSGTIIGNLLPSVRATLKVGVDFCLKKLLRLVVILMGLQYSLKAALTTGGQAMVVILAAVILGLISAYALGRWLGLSQKLSALIGVGTAICGASAIATVSPVIDAEDQDVALSIATIFLFNTLALLFYPLLGGLLGMSDTAFGTWVGTAVHDTSSVLATGFAYSEQAGLVGTVVKLTRTVLLVPLVAAFAIGMAYQGGKKTGVKGVLASFPLFILGFVALSAINSLGFISPEIASGAKSVSKVLVVVVMAAVGLSLDVQKLKVTGLRFLYTGFVASVVVGLASLLLIHLFEIQ